MTRRSRQRSGPPGRPVTRRRAITLIGAAAGLPLLPAALASEGATSAVYRWRGQALGADARMLLAVARAEDAEPLVARCLDEVRRLERIFSLYLPDSEIMRLNRRGNLPDASADLRLVLGEARRMAEASDGAFDVTVQPLWRYLADHFARSPASGGPTPNAELTRVRDLVDYRGVLVEGARIWFRRPGMAITLNGIAQGYITDRVADLMRGAGMDRVLIQLGETRALAPPSDGDTWRIAIPAADAESGPLRWDLADKAIATSSEDATRFEPSGRHNHILDPRTGTSPNRYRSVTVIAPSAMTADALSTALAAMDFGRAREALRSMGAEAAILVDGDGRRRIIEV